MTVASAVVVPPIVAENATEVTVAPRLAVGLAVTVTGEPTVAELLLAGAERTTDGTASEAPVAV